MHYHRDRHKGQPNLKMHDLLLSQELVSSHRITPAIITMHVVLISRVLKNVRYCLHKVNVVEMLCVVLLVII